MSEDKMLIGFGDDCCHCVMDYNFCPWINAKNTTPGPSYPAVLHPGVKEFELVPVGMVEKLEERIADLESALGDVKLYDPGLYRNVSERHGLEKEAQK